MVLVCRGFGVVDVNKVIVPNGGRRGGKGTQKVWFFNGWRWRGVVGDLMVLWLET